MPSRGESLFNRSQIAFMLGVVLVAIGMAVAIAVRVLSFARYMHLENLGLDVDPAVGPELFSQIVTPTIAERTFFYVSLGLVPAGLVLLILAWRLRPRPAG
jgi:sulfite exporter TauE/SafE